MLALPLVSALLTATAVSAGPLPLARRGYATKETHYVPRDWIVTSTSHPDQTLKLNIAVKQSRPEDFHAHLLAISHPDSPQYGDDFLTNDEIAAYNRPHQHHLEAVLAWLAEHGVEEHHLSFSHAKDWISLKIPVSKANYMLDTKFHTYTHSSGAQVNRVTSWSLPVYLHDM